MTTLGNTEASTTFPATAADVGADAAGAAASAQSAAATDATTKANAAQAASWPATTAFDATAPTTAAFGDAAAAGSAAKAAHRDHGHGMPALGTTAAAIGTSAGGAATTPSKSDHVHATGAGTPSTQAFGDAAATGTGPAAAMTDHKHAMMAAPTSVSGNAGTVTTNANLTGDVTSVGNATTATTAIKDKWTEVVATADQTVTNSAVLVNHTGGGGPALKFTAVSGGVYHVEFFLIYSGNDTAGDFRWNWGLPTVTGWHRWGEGFGASDTLTVNTGVIMSALTTFGADFIGGTDAVDGLRIAFEEFWFRAGANADMQLTFANSTASGGRTSTVRTGSVLRYRRLV